MSKLIVVPTPIGNLEDITFRAIKVLKGADLVLAEDTRKTMLLLKHFDISTPLQSYHKFNEHKMVENFVQQIASGKMFALVSDAGTPAISDPGYLIVKTCIENNIEVECLPGATAFVPAIVNSGLPNDRFTFEGFLPQKKGRSKKMKELADEKRTMVFYESPFRIIKTLQGLARVFGLERRASISRELSKIYEETIRDTLEGLIAHFTNHPPKGEFVLVVEGKK